MNFLLRTRTVFTLGALLSSGCIIVDDSDDDDAATTVSATSGQTTSGSSAGESSSSGLVESGSSGVSIDCSQCDVDIEPDALCHSSYDATSDVCVCDAGYVFVSSDPAGDSDFECERVDAEPPVDGCGSDPNNEINAEGQCVCVEGWEFCTTDLDDYTCCEA